MPSVAGDVEFMPLADVLAWLASRRQTGTLTIRRRNVENRFVVREGICTQASSTDPREYLGQHLINFGYIDEAQLQRAFDTQKETNVPLGRVLVMVEAITTDQLQKVLTFKTREGLLEALCWTEGQWRVVPEITTDPELDCERPIDLREAISEAMARQQMWAEIRRVFPSDATRVEVTGELRSADSAFDRRLLALMAAGKSVGEAALELRAMDFQTYARLYDLANRKLVRAKVTTSEVRLDALGFSAPHGVPVAPSASSFPTQQLHAASSLAPGTPAGPPRSPTPGVPWGARAPALHAPEAPSFGAELPDVDIDIAETHLNEAAASSPPPAVAPPSPTPPPARAPTPMGSFFGAGTYMMVKPEKVRDPPGVKVPPEAEDPQSALRLALAGRNWSDALTLSQRILELDPLNSEAIAAYRVADAQMRKLEKESGDADMSRVPRLAMPRDEIALAHLSSKERYVLSRVDGVRTLHQIAAVSPISPAELIRIVEGFVNRGVLRY